MNYKLFFIAIALFLFSCNSKTELGPSEELLAALGGNVKESFQQSLEEYEAILATDPNSYEGLYGHAETQIILYVFGYIPRDEALPLALQSYERLMRIDSLSSESLKLRGIINFLDWNWKETEESFEAAIEADPGNKNARHWYALYLSAMGRFDEAMAQSDIINTMDSEGQYLISRGSMLYFARKNIEMRDLLVDAVKKDSLTAWTFDWLGMAYCELEDFENSIKIYNRAFELSEGTVEVGAGLGHALGLAGEYKAAKRMADFYTQAADQHYLPPCQRAFIHVAISEYDMALELLEQAYSEKSWFLIFMNIEPWYDPIRQDERFMDIVHRMSYPG